MAHSNNIAVFQKYCESAIGKITEECLEKFLATKDDLSRIELMYDIAKKNSIEFPDTNGKSYNQAEVIKNEGNKFFAEKDYTNALKLYNNGIIKCPQSTVKERELLTILISNRSATYFELKEYKRVFNDIDYIMEVGDYPANLRFKLWLRKAKCYDNLNNNRSATEAYNEALENLKDSGLDEKTVKQKTIEIEDLKKSLDAKATETIQANQIVLKTDNKLLINDEKFTGGQEYVAANHRLTIRQDTYQGRYATALEDIEAVSPKMREGDVIWQIWSNKSKYH